MSIVTTTYIKDFFPAWNKFFLDENDEASEIVLQAELDQAEYHLQEYITFPDPLTDQVKRMVLIITRYFGFMRTQGDIEFKVKPYIIKEYEALIKRLESFRAGDISLQAVDVTKTASINVDAKPKIFNTWFNDEYGEVYPDPNQVVPVILDKLTCLINADGSGTKKKDGGFMVNLSFARVSKGIYTITASNDIFNDNLIASFNQAVSSDEAYLFNFHYTTSKICTITITGLMSGLADITFYAKFERA